METNETVIPPVVTEEKEEFLIDSPERANWLLRKLANLDAERERVAAQASALARQIESDRNSLLHRFGSQLENFTRAELEKSGGKRKSLVLLQGTVGFRTVPARIVIESAPDAIQTARLVLPGTITTETTERFDSKTFREHATKHFEETGELLPGIGRTEERQSFDIKFPASKGAGAAEGGAE